MTRSDVAGTREKSQILLLVLLLLLAAALAATLAWFLVLRPQESPALEADPNVGVGTLSKTRAERRAELEALVDESMITFAINATPMYSVGHGEAGVNWLIENPPENGNRFTVEVVRDDTGETVYQSGYLEPNQNIEYAPLDQIPPKGEYPCTAYFTAYTLGEDMTYIGMGGAALTLYIVD